MAAILKPEHKTHNQAKRKTEKKVSQPKINARPIWEMVAEVGAEISDEDWAKVPDDSSINFKHHLYQAPTKHA